MSTRRALLTSGGMAAILATGRFPLIGGAAAQDRYAKYKGQTIVINYPALPTFDATEKLFADFTKETGIKIERDKMQYLRMKDKQLLELGKPQGDYDIVTIGGWWKTEYVAKKLIDPLEPYFANAAIADPNYDIADIITPYREHFLVGGPRTYLPGPGAKLYAMPFGTETSVLGYRKDILAKHDIKPPVTYDELIAACRLVKQKESGMSGVTSRGQTGHQITTALMFHMTPHDGKVFDENWRVALTREPAEKAATALRALLDTAPPGVASFGFGEMLNAFLQGQTAFYLDSITVFGPAQDEARSKIAGKVGYAIHPKAVRHAGSLGGFGISIPSNARNKDAAFLFMQWITNKANDLRIVLNGGNAGRWSTLDQPDAVKKYPVEYPILKECLKVADLDWRPLIPEWDDISQRVIGLPMGEMAAGKLSPKDALAAAAPQAEAVAKAAGYLKS